MVSLDHIDLNLLRVFHAIVEERSLTRASERLALSQPAVSYSLSRLRTLFDDQLFIRTHAGMQPTPIALELAAIVGRALDTMREALHYAESFDPLVSTRTFRLSLSDAGVVAFLPAICKALSERAPRIKLRVQPLPVNEIADALRSSTLDFAIGNLPELMSRTRHQVLLEEDYVCMTRRRPGLPAGSKISLKQFVEASHVKVHSLEHSHYALDDALRVHGVGRDIALEVPYFFALPNVLMVTDLYATVPKRLAYILNKADTFQIYELPVQLPLASVAIHWHEHFDGEDGMVWMRNLLAETVNSFG
ncbi:LysR family transcriptional regulator [Paraburkholderia susongensis]|uniref:Transcriptional regulator /transcriptional regulator, LysR family n=1 Tax=Paraburkholderia susongensis TaxID=1515439 RepID=A0A1X7LSW2_9BURK|nr:LysR family transcriptional regulator [Paraburkholderia susongensis]SMG56229.1 transcriptional regulator /transcriptional regulator, LysR family [Paraburkholderia susongensis]